MTYTSHFWTVRGYLSPLNLSPCGRGVRGRLGFYPGIGSIHPRIEVHVGCFGTEHYRMRRVQALFPLLDVLVGLRPIPRPVDPHRYVTQLVTSTLHLVVIKLLFVPSLVNVLGTHRTAAEQGRKKFLGLRVVAHLRIVLILEYVLRAVVRLPIPDELGHAIGIGRLAILEVVRHTDNSVSQRLLCVASQVALAFHH